MKQCQLNTSYHLKHATNIKIHCPSHDAYHETLRWQFTEPLGTCVYNIYDELSFIIGWLSVASWTFALLPQIITNCKNKAAESQSFYFWLLWLLGDICNFIGCILTKNLVTNIALAFVYLSLTIFACLQFIWYEWISPKHRYQQQYQRLLSISERPTAILSMPDIEITRSPLAIQTHSQSVDRTYHLSEKNNMGSGAAMYPKPSFLRRHRKKSSLSSSMSPGLRCTLDMISMSPRMYTISPNMSPKMRREYLTYQGMHDLAL